METEHQQKELM